MFFHKTNAWDLTNHIHRLSQLEFVPPNGSTKNLYFFMIHYYFFAIQCILKEIIPFQKSLSYLRFFFKSNSTATRNSAMSVIRKFIAAKHVSVWLHKRIISSKVKPVIDLKRRSTL